MSLKNKVAIVTGGNSGIGQAIVLELARQDATIVIDYVAHPEATDALERQVAKLGSQSIGVEADVSKVGDLHKLVAAAVSRFGRLDIMVNNAGIETRTSVIDTSEDQYDKVLAINLKSAFFGTQIAAKQMIKQGSGGRIINITSVHEDWPMPGNTPYCLAKGGMRMLTRTAGLELARHNILVVGVGPGAVATPINLSTMKDPAKLAQLNPRYLSDAWRGRRRSPPWSVSSPATARAISPRRPSSRMAASCTAASAYRLVHVPIELSQSS
jgi:glucose 1-dehydrogenase